MIQLRTENFENKQIISNLKYKIFNYKKEIKLLHNKKINDNLTTSTDCSTDDEKQEKRKINYYELKKLSSK